MKKKLETQFSTRQYMLSKDFELYYYNDSVRPRMALHTHDYYEFYFFLEGDVSIQIGQKVFPLAPGDIIVIPPRVSHVAVIHSMDLPYRRFVFWISQDFCSYLLDQSPDYGYLMQLAQTRKNYIFHNDKITFKSIQSKILRLLTEMQGNRFCKTPLVLLYVSDLILHMNRLIYERNHPERAEESESLYQNICTFIDSHIEEDLSLDRLSKKRLALCRQAILGDMSISQVYQTYGFGDYSSFFRAFKKEYGVSPRDYKDMNLLDPPM